MIIAGTHSGVGKTSVTLALVTALRKKLEGTDLQGRAGFSGSFFIEAGFRKTLLQSGRLDEQPGLVWKTGFIGPAGRRMWPSLKGSLGFLMGPTPKSSRKENGRDRPGGLQAPVFLIVNAHGQAKEPGPIG